MAKVYISPSTQENNKGVGNYGTEEYRMHQIADIVYSELKRHGIVVYKATKSMSLNQIVADSNNKNPDLHLAIHSNANEGKARGCEVFCYRINSKYTGYQFAKKIYDRIAAITPTSDRGVKQGYNYYGPGKHMYEVAYTNASAALVEVAFHDNIEDAKWIISNIKKIGVELAKATLDQLGIKYKEEKSMPEYTGIMKEAFEKGWITKKGYDPDQPITMEKLMYILKNFENYLVKKYINSSEDDIIK